MNDAANDNMCIKRRYYSNRSCADVVINSSRPNPRRREKINLNFYFHTFLWCLKSFYEGLKGLHKTFLGTTKK